MPNTANSEQVAELTAQLDTSQDVIFVLQDSEGVTFDISDVHYDSALNAIVVEMTPNPVEPQRKDTT